MAIQIYSAWSILVLIPCLRTIYAASYQGALAALDISNGHVNWNRDLSSYAGLAADNKLIYVSATNGDVVAVDIKTGATFWLQSALQGRILSKPAIMDKYIVLGDDDGYIHWLDKNSGNLLGRYQLDKNGVEATLQYITTLFIYSDVVASLWR